MLNWKLGDKVVDETGKEIPEERGIVVDHGFAIESDHGVSITKKGLVEEHAITLSLEELHALAERFLPNGVSGTGVGR